ncbi:Arabinanase/levansucrase/invertase [Coniochaeta hoffmannii]|uniref:Arabinanase/levansucrase/invertase n=1 Tax=Coniochaeta hoffmannii TaxID=91930 RepID=A0AA38RFW1_9PEZI|nr:Arabinanase/levansucrase/invertase [Coniochaeta hoffmannii]
MTTRTGETGTPVPEPASTFHNPILRGFNPDPTICRVPATASTPTTFFLSTSTFEYFPGCAIYASTNLVDWKLIGHALTRRSQLDLRTVEPGAGSWASTLRYRPDEGRFYLANGLFHRYRPAGDERVFPRGFYVWTDNIWDDGAWSDPVYFDNPGFDQDLFWDDAVSPAKVYLSTTVRVADRPRESKQKDFAIHISEIDLATGRTLTPPVVIRSSPHGIAEGSHILRRGGWYYLFTAEGGTEAGHQEWVFRSRKGPLGPWEGTGKPLWYNGPDEEVQRTGHADVFEDGEGRWWAVLLGVRPVKVQGASGTRWLEPQLGRESFLVKVDWVDDWPVFNEGKNITLLTKGRDNVSRATSSVDTVWNAHLSGPELELGWYQKHTPIKRHYSLTERPGYLRLYGNCYDLSSPEAPAMLLRKQTSYTGEVFQVKMTFNPRRPGYEAGVVLWWNSYSYATVGLTAATEPEAAYKKTVIIRTPTGRPGEMRILTQPERPDDGEVELSVSCLETGYNIKIWAGQLFHSSYVAAEDLTVAPPVGGTFAGVMYGVYSFGKGEPVLDPADFRDIRVTRGR